MTVLAIDQGTTSTKAFLLHPDGVFQPVGTRKHRQYLPRDGWVEHDAAELIAHVEDLIDAGLAMTPDLAGLALANQGETVVAWNRQTGTPLAPAIVWQDQRTQGVIEALPAGAAALVSRIAGLPLDPYFSATKLAWLIDHVPGARDLAVTGHLGLATSDAFFLDRLTGAYTTDITTASRTSLMALDKGRWNEDLCALFGVPMGLLPSIRPTVSGFGSVRRGGRDLPVVASVVDQQAALYGHGCRHDGDLKITFGTGTFALAITGAAARRDAPGLVPTIAWQIGDAAPVHALDGGDYTAAAAVDWAIGVGLAADLSDFDLPDGSSALERGLVFVPALAGLAAPHWDRAAGGAFLGLRQATTAADLRRAVLEGIALRAVELVEVLAGHGTGAISIDGGLTRNDAFVRFLADALGRTVILRDHADLTALGAAELGYAGLGRPAPPRAAGLDRAVSPSPASGAIRAARTRFAAAIAAVRSLPV
jgi:glycerol kinase